MKKGIALFLLLFEMRLGVAQIAEIEGNVRITDNLPKLEFYDSASGEQRVEVFWVHYQTTLCFQP